MILINITGPNRIFSLLEIEAKLVENYSLWDSKMTNFTSITDLNMHNYYYYYISIVKVAFFLCFIGREHIT